MKPYEYEGIKEIYPLKRLFNDEKRRILEEVSEDVDYLLLSKLLDYATDGQWGKANAYMEGVMDGYHIYNGWAGPSLSRLLEIFN